MNADAEQLFVVAAPGGTVPFRDRGDLATTSMRFGPDADGFVVYVSADAFNAISTATNRFAPAEGFGLLVGRTYRDHRGTYTVIAGLVEADAADSGIGHVTISAARMATLRRLASTRFPAADLKGWWHSHSAASGFSATDRDEQRTWPNHTDVGLLTFMEGNTWGVAYRGPQARPLAPSSSIPPRTARTPRPAVAAQAPARSVPASPVPVSPAPPARVPPTPAPVVSVRERRRCRASLAAWAGWTATGLLVAGAAALIVFGLRPALREVEQHMDRDQRQLRQVEQQVDGLKLVVPPAIPWQCTMPDQTHVRCTASPNPAITSFVWNFSDGTQAVGDTVDHVVSPSAPATVRLIAETKAGPIEAGTLVLQLPGASAGNGATAGTGI